MPHREKIGEIDVDAGIVWVGDPCYVLGADSSHGVATWQEFCATLDRVGHFDSLDGVSEPLGQGIGLTVQTTYGDGSYPVYAERNSEGRIARIVIDFDELED